MDFVGPWLTFAGIALLVVGVSKAAGVHSKYMGPKMEAGGAYIFLGVILLIIVSRLGGG